MPQGGDEQGGQDDDHAGDPSADPRGGQPVGRGGRTRAEVAEPRPAGHDDDEHALQPPAQLVRRVGLQDRLPVHRGHEVGGARDGEQEHDQPRRGSASPDTATAAPHTSTATTSATPWWRTRRIQPDDRPARDDPIAIEANSQPTAAAEPLRRGLREQRAGHREEHRRDVDRERQQQHRVLRDERETLDDGPQPRHLPLDRRLAPVSGGSAGSRSAA